MTGVITWTFDCGDGVCIEREQPSTALKPMPHFTTFDNFSSPDVYHPEFQPEADDFMKLGDIKGEFTSKAVFCPFDQPVDIITNVTGDGSDQLQLETGSGFDRLTGYPGAGTDELAREDDPMLMPKGTRSENYCTGYCFDGGSTENVNGTIGYEMEAGTDLRSDNRFVFEPMDVMPSLGESIDPGLDAAGGFQPHDVSAVQIGVPPEPELWLHTLG